ncbi:hypothetical protein ABZP36_022591 [Zizania latifolia]
MAPPAVAGETAAAADQESAWTDGKGRRRWRHDCAGAGARLLSLVVQAAVMYAALALFLLFAAAATVLLLHLVVTARAFRNQQYRGSRYRVPQASPLSSLPPRPLPGGPPPHALLLCCFLFPVRRPFLLAAMRRMSRDRAGRRAVARAARVRPRVPRRMRRPVARQGGRLPRMPHHRHRLRELMAPYLP